LRHEFPRRALRFAIHEARNCSTTSWASGPVLPRPRIVFVDVPLSASAGCTVFAGYDRNWAFLLDEDYRTGIEADDPER